jgi:hypothetical protein
MMPLRPLNYGKKICLLFRSHTHMNSIFHVYVHIYDVHASISIFIIYK